MYHIKIVLGIFTDVILIHLKCGATARHVGVDSE